MHPTKMNKGNESTRRRRGVACVDSLNIFNREDFITPVTSWREHNKLHLLRHKKKCEWDRLSLDKITSLSQLLKELQMFHSSKRIAGKYRSGLLVIQAGKWTSDSSLTTLSGVYLCRSASFTATGMMDVPLLGKSKVPLTL